jgi:hypothetical protein
MHAIFRRTTLAACASLGLSAALLGQAQAATYKVQSSLSQLQLSVTDLTPGDANVAGFSLNANNPEQFVGAATLVDPLNGQGVVKQLARSNPVTLASPFDASSLSTLSEIHRTAQAEAGQGHLSSSVGADTADAAAAAQSLAAAINLDWSSEQPLPTHNAITLAAYSSLTISGKAHISLSVNDATACPDCVFEVDAQAVLISSELFDRLLSNSDTQTLEITANMPGLLDAAGLSLTLGASSTLPQSIDRDLSITIVNNTANSRQLGLAATTWASISGVPEPETWAMALCGLAVGGVSVQRKRHQG